MEERKVGFEKRAMVDILLRSISTSHETLVVVVIVIVVVIVVIYFIVVVVIVVGIVVGIVVVPVDKGVDFQNNQR